MSDRTCEYPECFATDEDDLDIHTYGFTIDGLVEHEVDYCATHAPSSEVIDP